MIGTARHVQTKLGFGVGIDLAQETFGVGIGVIGGIKGLALDRMEVRRHLLHLKESGSGGEFAVGLLGINAAG